jgi:large subunit ribosomal protein L13e
MGFKHNNGTARSFDCDWNALCSCFSSVLHANHFRKDWQRRVRTWFDQPGSKVRRRQARKAKAASLGVRPLTLLRPAVRAQTVRYNRKIREGRGFTLAELKEAGVGRKEARGVGIVVDHRRRNLSEEGKALNVERLQAYKAKLIVFPRKVRKSKKGDTTKASKPKKGDTTVRPLFSFTRCCSNLRRVMISTLPPPVSTWPSRLCSRLRHPVKSPRRSTASTPLRPSATPSSVLGTKVDASYVPPR